MSGHSPRIIPYPVRTLAHADASGYDAALASLGFETRCREIPAAIGAPAIRRVIPFGDRHEHDYATNQQWFADNGWELVDVVEKNVATWTADWLAGLSRGRSEAVRVAVDLSSMSRLRIAAAIEALLSLPADARASVDLLYTPAEFEPRDPNADPQVFDVAPVSDYFAGWWTDLSAPLVAIIGVGYELEMAASAIDKLEPETAVVFIPAGEDDRYAPAVADANVALMHANGVASQPYAVADPFGCFGRLEATLAKHERRFRVAFVPLGPKIFAACAMLAAGLHQESAQVIRVTSGSRARAVNRRSNGKLCGLTVLDEPAPGHRAVSSATIAEGHLPSSPRASGYRLRVKLK